MISKQSEDKLHVLIIGGGIVGLLLAQALKKNNISSIVVEEEESKDHHRPREWSEITSLGISIQWALPLLEQILPQDLLDQLQATSVDSDYVVPDTGTSMPVYNVATGELMKNIPIVKMLRVSRRKFRALCAKDIEVQYKRRVTSINVPSETTRPVAIFEDGSFEIADIIIGADGANSTVRQSIFAGQEGVSEQIPYTGVNMHVCYKNAHTARLIRESLSPLFAIGIHPKGYWLWLSTQDVPASQEPENWVFQLQWTWKIGSETKALSDLELEELKAVAADFAEPFRTAWIAIPDGTRVAGNRISIWQPQAIPDSQFKGKVALLGDAAHAMSFHRGQGLNHGIADVLKICEVLCNVKNGEKSLDAALQEYEEDMVKRAGEEVMISKMNTEMVHDWNRFMSSPFMQRGGDKNK